MPTNDPVEDSVAPGTSEAVGEAATRVIDETPGPNIPNIAGDVPAPAVEDAAAGGLDSLGDLAERVLQTERTVSKLVGTVVSGKAASEPLIEAPMEVAGDALTTLSDAANDVPWTHRSLFGRR